MGLFLQAPVLGVGPGAFAGSAFEADATGSLSGAGVWTSPHNIVLHLMSEAGLAGLLLVGIAFWVWVRDSSAQTALASMPAQCFFLCGAGVGLLHSMVEFPLWSAHFLALTALFMGLAVGGRLVSPASPSRRVTGLAACALMAVSLGWLARDYLLLDATRITGTDRPVFGRVEVDAIALESLARGPLGAEAEKWAFAGVAGTAVNLQAKLELSERVVWYWPSAEFVAKRAALLAIERENAAEH
jgi:hypothetical protein